MKLCWRKQNRYLRLSQQLTSLLHAVMRRKTHHPQGTSLDSIKMTHTTYYKLSHTILLLCYHALRTSDACAFTRSTTEILSRNQETSDSHQCCRMDIKKEKEKPTERSVRPQPKEGLLIAKATLALQESITYNYNRLTTPKGFISHHSALPVDLKNSISIQTATTITL